MLLRRPPIQSRRKPRGVAQLVAHRSPKPGVAGSSPVAPAAPPLLGAAGPCQRPATRTASHATAHHQVRQPAMHQPHAAATLMSCNSPEPATPPASRSWFAISPGFHADDPGTITPALSGRPPLNACNPYPYRPTSKHPRGSRFLRPDRVRYSRYDRDPDPVHGGRPRGSRRVDRASSVGRPGGRA